MSIYLLADSWLQLRVCLFFMGQTPSIPSTNTDTHMHSLMDSIPLNIAAKSSPSLPLSPLKSSNHGISYTHKHTQTYTHNPAPSFLLFPSLSAVSPNALANGLRTLFPLSDYTLTNVYTIASAHGRHKLTSANVVVFKLYAQIGTNGQLEH